MGSVVGTINEETPRFEVVHKINENTEIRSYGPMLLVETPMDEGDSAFTTLASYIGAPFLGNAQNEQAEAIPMTVPVLVENANPSGIRILI